MYSLISPPTIFLNDAHISFPTFLALTVLPLAIPCILSIFLPVISAEEEVIEDVLDEEEIDDGVSDSEGEESEDKTEESSGSDSNEKSEDS